MGDHKQIFGENLSSSQFSAEIETVQGKIGTLRTTIRQQKFHRNFVARTFLTEAVHG